MRRGRIPELGLFLLGYQLLQNIGLTNIPPLTLVAVVLQVAIYLNVVNVPRLCLSGAGVARERDWARLGAPPLKRGVGAARCSTSRCRQTRARRANRGGATWCWGWRCT